MQQSNGQHLVYVPDAQADRVPDFSDVGYRGGETALPNVPPAMTINPIGGDNTGHIQAAIDQVASLPLNAQGFRGAVVLAPGAYDIAGQLTIADSGVVLRGGGADPGDVVLHATGTSQRDLIRILGSGSQSTTGSTRQMIDKTVPVGARSFRVNTTSGFSVGDTVRITRPSTANWISDLGMDMIPPRPDGNPITQWQAGSFDIRFDRVITRIEGDRVFVDAPLTNSFEQQYGGGQIKRYTWADRIENVGVENLSAESEFASATDEDHSWNFVTIDKAQNVWVRDTVSAHFARSAVLSHPGAKWVTVDNAINLTPKSRITGGRRYTFDLSGQLELVTNSEANEGRHDFVNNSTRPAGPHVFHNSVANNALDESGPHQRWATGSLFDRITVDGDQINARNRGYFGTGHGWAGANMVIWNSEADSYIVQNPPTAQNWLVGSTGTIIEDTTFGPQPPGYVDSHGEAVEIDSLYEAQLAAAADITSFRWAGGVGDWGDPEAWQENVTPATYAIETRDYLYGDIDDFTHDGALSDDDAFVDPAWESEIIGSSAHPITGFDDTAGNQNVAFTATHLIDPSERVVHATLALALKSDGGQVDSDFVRLFDSDADHKFDFSELGWDTPVATGETFVGVLNLAAFTDELQTGAINVQINDDTGADWALYTAAIAKPIASSAPVGVIVDGGGEATIGEEIDNVNALLVGGESAGALELSAGGSLVLADSYTQAANGSLTIEVAGDNASEFGTIFATNAVSLAGSLQVELDAAYDPAWGDALAIIDTDGAILGSFDSLALPNLSSGLGWQLAASASSIALEVILEGDFNLDGVVNAADYTVWRNTLGSTTELAADANNDFVVDAADYALWRLAYGNSVEGLGAGSQGVVPEPSTALIFIFSMVFAATRRSLFSCTR